MKTNMTKFELQAITACFFFVYSVVCPNGLITNLFDPVAGQHHHDAFMLHESNLLLLLQAKLQLCQFSHCMEVLLIFFANTFLDTTGEHIWLLINNCLMKRMSKVCGSIEWSFGKVVWYFAFVDFRKNLKVLLQPVGKYYMVGSLLINCHTCLYGSVTSSYFNLQPPDLGTYLSNWCTKVFWANIFLLTLEIKNK